MVSRAYLIDGSCPQDVRHAADRAQNHVPAHVIVASRSQPVFGRP
jgi:hypothetical protein